MQASDPFSKRNPHKSTKKLKEIKEKMIIVKVTEPIDWVNSIIEQEKSNVPIVNLPLP